MAEMIAPGALDFAGALRVGPMADIAGPAADATTVTPPSMPLLSSRAGDLFTDALDPTAHWYLPQLSLAGDPDAAFAFTAEQASQQAGGQPYDTARLALRLVTSQPADVAQFAAANPAVKLQPIPLAGLGAVLSSPYADQSGAQRQRSFTASAVQTQADGSVVLTFDNGVAGDAVAALYQDLRLFGKAGLALNATFQTWTSRWVPPSPPRPPLPPPGPIHRGPLPQVAEPSLAATPHALFQAAPLSHPFDVPPFSVGGHQVEYAAPQVWSQPVPLGLKYAADAYQLRYTVAGPHGAPAVLTGVDQLTTLGVQPPSFVELTALGDLNQTYPSLARAFVGVLSPEIMLIPSRYAILRGRQGVSATCIARVDSSAAEAAACMFEFSFTVAPQVSRVEMQQFQAALLQRPDLEDRQIVFPTTLGPASASSLMTSFGSTAQFGPGPSPNTFAVTLTIQDAGVQAPAVADANLIIQRLCSGLGANLAGTLELQVDASSGLTTTAGLDLNFLYTAGSDELALEVADATLAFTNLSSFDLTVSRFSVVAGSDVTVVPQAFAVAAGTTVSAAVPAGMVDSPAPQVAADSQLLLPGRMTAAEGLRLLNFVSVNVADTHVFIAADASAVDFRQTTTVSVTVAFSPSAGVASTSLPLTSAAPVNSAKVILPLEDAVFSVPATVQVQATLASGKTVAFATAVDFATEPTFLLSQQDIDAHALAS